MKTTLIVFLLAFSLAFPVAVQLVPNEALAAQTDGTVYANARFGFTVAVPPGHFSLIESDNGSGITVLYRNGMELRVYGSLNPMVFGTGCKDSFEEAKDLFDEVTYARLNEAKGWFVLSGYKDGTIRYLKQFVGLQAANTAEMVYPKAKVKELNAFVNDVVKSFAPGNLNTEN